MRFQLLGPIAASEDDGPIAIGGPKQRLVLAHLLLRANTTVPIEYLIDAVWGEEPPDTSRATLQAYVSRLRSALGPQRIEGQAPGYRFHALPEELDATRFETLLREAREDGLQPKESLAVLDEAMELWRGPALADLAFEPSLQGEIARMEQLRLVATEDRLAARLDLGQHLEVVAELEAATAADPTRERLWCQLILALYRSGRQADALAAFDRARELLADELGIDPSRELQEIHRRVLRQDGSLLLQGEPLRGYRLLDRIGEGAIGAVYRAIQPHIEREVAIKSIHAGLVNHPDFVRRFEREAQLVARLEHPHIVPLYDYWREPDAAYLIMRLLRGGSLEDLLRDRPLESEPAALILDQIGAALSAAHHQGVVHGDVKPGNVLLDEGGNAYLSDFGIALETGAPDQPAGTMVRETPVYLSPEQINLEQTSPRSDIYALGVVLYEMLTGEHPFPGTSLNALLDQQLHHPIPSVRERRPDLPRAVDAAIARATAKDPRERFADVLDLCSAFRGAIGGAQVVVRGELRNPYKGLRAFLEADGADFFGRELLTRRLLGRLAENDAARFLCVVGPSGSGKSSVVRAGLVPAIRRGVIPGSERWYVVDLQPGPHPLRELETALLGVSVDPPPSLFDELERDERGLTRAVGRILPEPEAELLIVIDQFEEVFSMTDSEVERAHVLEMIRAATADPNSRVRIVATLRADFFDLPLSVRGFGDLLASRNEAITPMSPEEIERAIVGPAERVGLDVEPGLVAAMVADVIDRPGALPLLQYALTELADGEDVAVLTLNAYRKIGGVPGALARRAERLYDALDQGARAACRQLFLRLVSLGEGTEETRRRVRRSELPDLDGGAMQTVMDEFGRHRLLSFDRDPSTREQTIEIAHEALLDGWSRLRGWVDDARDDIRAQRRLAAAAVEWERNGRDPSLLLRGARLDQTKAWEEATTLAISEVDRTFLDESLAVQRAALERERTLERRSIRRMRSLVGICVAAALVATTLTVIAVDQRGRAEDGAREARARELAATAIAQLDIDTERALLLAIEAVQTTRSVNGTVLRDAEEALHQAVGASRLELSLPGRGGDTDWSPTGVFVTTGTFASEGPRIGSIDIRDAETGAIVRSFPGHLGEITGVAFGPDGSVLATTGKDGTLKVWDPSTGDLLTIVSGRFEAFGPSFSGDGSRVAALWGRYGDDTERTLRVVDLTTGVPLTFRFAWESIDTALSPDGRRIAVGTGFAPGIMRVIDLETREVVRLEGRSEFGFSSVSWSPDGRYVAAGGWDDTPEVWDAATGRLRFSLAGHTDGAYHVDWSPDSSHLVTGAQDATARVWEIADEGPREIAILAAPEGTISAVAFSPDGTRVMTGSDTSAVKVWDVGPTGDAEWAILPATHDAVFMRAGSEVLATGVDGSLTVWDLGTGQDDLITPRALGPTADEIVQGSQLSPDGTAVAISYGDDKSFKGGAAESWTSSVRDVATGEELFAIDDVGVLGDEVSFVEWSPDGEHLMARPVSGSTTVFDRAGNEVGVLPDAGLEVSGWEFSPDGRLIATTDDDSLRIWDWRRGEVVAKFPAGETEAIAFDPPGTRLATAQGIWDVRSGRVLVRLPSLSADVQSLVFSPGGARLAVGSADNSVRLLDAESGEELLLLEGHRGAVVDLGFSPDGSMLASVSEDDGMVRIWALDTDDLLEIARGEVTRSLTDEECRRYVHVDSCPNG